MVGPNRKNMLRIIGINLILFALLFGFVNAVLSRKPQNGRLIVYAGSVLVFTILAIEEIHPIWGASTYFDPFDVWASGLGSICSIVTFELAARNAH